MNSLNYLLEDIKKEKDKNLKLSATLFHYKFIISKILKLSNDTKDNKTTISFEVEKELLSLIGKDESFTDFESL